jgi:hypothetical protein
VVFLEFSPEKKADGGNLQMLQIQNFEKQ